MDRIVAGYFNLYDNSNYNFFSEFSSLDEIVEKKKTLRGGIACELDDSVNLRLEVYDNPAFDQLFWEFQVKNLTKLSVVNFSAGGHLRLR